MSKTKLKYLLMLLPAAVMAAEGFFLINQRGYYSIDGIVGLVSLALALFAGWVISKEPKPDGEKKTPRLAMPICFLLAAAARVWGVIALKNKGFDPSIPRHPIFEYGRLLRLLLGICAAVCFVYLAVECIRKGKLKGSFLYIPTCLCFSLEVIACFLDDPINSANASLQRVIVSLCLLSLLVVYLFKSVSLGADGKSVRMSVLFSAAAVAYCLPGLIQAALLGAKTADWGVPLACVGLALAGFNTDNITDKSEDNDEQ